MATQSKLRIQVLSSMGKTSLVSDDISTKLDYLFFCANLVVKQKE